MQNLLALLILFSADAIAAQDCSTLELAKEALVREALKGDYPFSGNYTIDDFEKLRPVGENGEVYCHPYGDECGESDIDYGMRWSFEPGARGWIGVTETCEFDYAITFRD